jgi:peptide/nickel transport system ATP-binding protein
MYLGKVAEMGTTENIFNNPSHPYTKTLLESVPKVGETDAKYEEVNPNIPSPRNPPEGCRFHTRCPVVIPPDNFEFQQNEWRSIFDYKLDLRSGKLTHKKLASMADQQGIDKNKENMVELVRDKYDFEETLSDSAAQKILTESLTHLIEEETDSAYQTIAEVFQSPCEQKAPSSSAVADDHEAFCHLN